MQEPQVKILFSLSLTIYHHNNISEVSQIRIETRILVMTFRCLTE